jgi:altronate hydrolase
MSIATQQPFLFLHDDDDIAVARHSTPARTSLTRPTTGEMVVASEAIEQGHKIAVRPVRKGQPVRKFGQVIGFATSDIQPGVWVHTHNMGMGELSLDYQFCTDIPPVPAPLPERTFLGYRRPDGRAATRNYIGIVSTVNCSATASKYVAEQIDKQLLADYPHIDGIVALTHKGGCAFEFDGDDHRQLARTLGGFAKHANIGAYLVMGLGCEASQPSYLVEEYGLVQLKVGQATDKPLPLVMNIQDHGGVAKTVDRAVEVLAQLLPKANEVKRVPIPVSEIILGTECGGSDGNSGVTANPAVGHAADLLVALGATAILAEVPEMYGAEHMLIRRAINREVGEKLIERIHWWEDYAAKFGVQIDNNPSVGNKKGGLTTIYEKSLGAVAKGGTTALRAVYEYAEKVTEKGFVIMDTPGFDPASVTGMIAGGANMIVFTTGRGSCFGCKPVPTIKIASNTPMYNRLEPDMDINAGRIMDGATVEEVGEEILEKIISVASGEKTKSEAQNIGDEEFCPWVTGPVL